MRMDEPKHIPILVTEVLRELLERPEQQVALSRGAGRAQAGGLPSEERLFIDGTVGQGGHARAILASLPGCRLLGIDRDPVNLAIAQERLASFGVSVVLVRDSYANVKTHAKERGFEAVDGILLDVGFSSLHVDDPSRGFSFQADGPLDMRYDRTGELTAEAIVNGWNVDELAQIFRLYGEEPFARPVAKAIYDARKRERITTTLQLAALVSTVIHRRGKMHPATRVFQALRIAVNDELGELQRALPELVSCLKPGGRIAVISFHSLEDRIVKQFFASQSGHTLAIINKRVITPTEEEIRSNPRSRSAKLRVAERI